MLVILAFAFRSQILTGIADYLIVSDKLEPADVIVLLNSEVNTRPFRTSELYQQGLAPVIVIARSESTPTVDLGLVPNDTDVSVAVMEKLAFPANEVVPVISPVDALRERPLGSEPALTAYVYGATPLLAVAN